MIAKLAGVALLAAQTIVRIGPAPVVTITAPTADPTYDNGSDATLTTLAGSASVLQGTVSTCTWTNAQGGSGAATGTTTWTIASVDLVDGANLITVRCATVAGNAGLDVITVTRSLALPAENPISAARLPAADTTLPNPAWAAAGVIGGIPTRTTICSNLGVDGQASTFVQSVTLAQVNNAIASCPANGVVLLQTGRYNFSSGIVFNGENDVTLRGEGAHLTKLHFTGYANVNGQFAAIGITGSNFGYYGPGPPTNQVTWGGTNGVAGVYTQGATVVTLSSTPGLSVGMWIELDQLSDTAETGDILNCGGPPCTEQGSTPNGRNNRHQHQRVRVVSCTPSCPNAVSTQVTITPGVYMPNYRTAKSPGAWWGTSTSLARGNGVENLSIDTSAASCGGCVSVSHVLFMWAYDSWVKGVRGVVCPSPKQCVNLFGANHISVVDNYFYSASQFAIGMTTYGVETFGSYDNLVMNNIMHHRVSPFVSDGDAGSVFAYNYTFDDYYPISPPFMQASNYTHEAGNGMILHEGNEGTGLKQDVIHGTANMMTYFRNRMIGWEPGKTNETAPVLVYAHNRYTNMLGNVSGQAGFHTNYQGTSDVSIYHLGDGYSSIAFDPLVATTALRWCNWDVVTSTNVSGTNDQTGTRCQASEVPTAAPLYPNTVPASQVLPASLFLSEKPSWWGPTIPWPAIGPDVTGGNVANSGGHTWRNPAHECWLNSADDTAYAVDASGFRPKIFNADACYPAP